MKKYIIYCFAMLSVLATTIHAFSQGKNNDFEISKNLDVFTELYKQLDIYYVDDVNPGELMKSGIDAMLETLDPFTNFIPEAEIEDYRLLTTGEYGGIGALIHRQGDFVVISEPYLGFPAEKNGLLAGDKILKVDDQDATGKSTDDVSKILKGEPGTSIRILVEREGIEKPFLVELQRENIKIDNIPYYGMLNDNVGYIKLTSFTQNAGAEVKKAFLELKDDHDLKGLVFDLRGNGGGLLHEAVNIVNIFSNEGELVVSTKGKDSKKNNSYYTTKKPTDLEIPLVFLVDPGSASASEIVSGAIQDLDRGIILGQRTYGKGLVQNVFPLSYNSKVKVTVAKYYIPSGRCIQAIDYSHKDDEGIAHKIPDSLISEFSTKNGRKVYDGGGIDPDIKMEPEMLSPIAMALFTKYLIFDYATKFHREHDSIPPSREFIITEDMYQDFISYVHSRDFEYTTASEKNLKKLMEVAEKEKYLDDIQDEINLLETKLMHNKDEDLLTHREQISEILKIEIASRYYYQKGKVEANLSTDPEIKMAIELIEEKQQYTSILEGIPDKAEKLD
nr:S41 family peptidase [Bacteroidota bacterium]